MNARIERYRRQGAARVVNGMPRGREWHNEHRVVIEGLTEAEARIVRDFLDQLDVEDMR